MRSVSSDDSSRTGITLKWREKQSYPFQSPPLTRVEEYSATFGVSETLIRPDKHGLTDGVTHRLS
jgi:hypothetical protein